MNKQSMKIQGICRIYEARRVNSGTINNPLFTFVKGDLLHEAQNIVTTVGLQLIAQKLLGSASDSLTHIAVGSGTTTATTSDIALETEIERNALFSSSASGGIATLTAFFTSSEAAGSWREAGILTASTGGLLFDRVNINFTKTTENVFVEFEITFANES